jgi:double-strand break repair protein MRE11
LEQGKGKAVDHDSDQGSVDSMMMELDAVGSAFEEPPSDPPPPKKRAATKAAPAKAKKPAAPAKKPPAKGRGKKVIVSGASYFNCTTH